MLLFNQHYNKESTKQLVCNSFVFGFKKLFKSAAEVHTTIDVGGGSAHCRAALYLLFHSIHLHFTMSNA